VQHSNEILTAVISGIKREGQSEVQHMGVCLAATKALYHMLELCKPRNVVFYHLMRVAVVVWWVQPRSSPVMRINDGVVSFSFLPVSE